RLPSGGGSIESGRSDGRGMAHSQPAAPRSGRTWSTDPGQAANGQRYSLGSALALSLRAEAGARPRPEDMVVSTKSALPQITNHQAHLVGKRLGKCLYGDLLPFLTHIVVRDESQVLCTGFNALAGFHCSNRPVLIRSRRID